MKKRKENNKVFVTRPSLPLLKDFLPYIKDIWESKWLTNQGKYHKQFEKELANYLGVKYVSLFANGTLALIAALQVLRTTGEVITTPYSFVATTHALYWNRIKPVFCDIEPNTMNIDPEKIEKHITSQTTAVLPVHVYGNPCNMKRIEEIADIYGLKIIYDACHAFGVKKNGNSILNYGDLSVLSFHATKIFTTMEGGAVICHDEKIKKRLSYLKNFGFAGETRVVAPGINAKMNELQAALGLIQLKHVNDYIKRRKEIANYYRRNLENIKGISFLKDMNGITHNYAYFPILIDKKKYGIPRDKLYEKLKENDIYGRRYFYPLISQFPPYRNFPSANDKNHEVICLPIYPDLKKIDLEKIINIIKSEEKKA
ncbi:MAG: DegT/DnrJ/EryC1/StrS family aminotransferase [Candidatus Helarchaeota archaeon]